MGINKTTNISNLASSECLDQAAHIIYKDFAGRDSHHGFVAKSDQFSSKITLRPNNVVSTSLRRHHDVAATSQRRYYDDVCLLDYF